MKFTANMLLTCIIYCDAGPGCLIKTACKYGMQILIMDIICPYSFFLWRS